MEIIMYNPQLDVFIKTADEGSFTKAADELYISPTAVMKQINSLESRIGVKLIERTNRGISLTEAGKAFYKEAKLFIEYSNNAISRIKRAAEDDRFVIRVGTSMLNPCKPLMELLKYSDDVYDKFRINIIPFEDEHTNILTVIESIGSKFDFIFAACNSPQWLSRCNFFKIGDYDVCCAVPGSHRLASKRRLSVSDLRGEALIMMERGGSYILDDLRDRLSAQELMIKIEDASFYDIDVFNRCERTGGVLLTLSGWSDIHPSLITIPVDWDYKMPYGLLYPLDPNEHILSFLEIIKAAADKAEYIK